LILYILLPSLAKVNIYFLLIKYPAGWAYFCGDKSSKNPRGGVSILPPSPLQTTKGFAFGNQKKKAFDKNQMPLKIINS